MTTPHRPMPLDLAALLTLGLVLQALALTLPITRTGALAITGLSLVLISLLLWVVRTLETNHHEANHHDTAHLAYTHHPESSNR
jgi:hypothetical protein